MIAKTTALETPRLVLCPVDLLDARAVQAVFPQWEIVRFLGGHVPWPYPADGAETFIRERVLPAMQQGVEWHWSIRPKVSPDCLIGMISLREKPDDNRGLWIDPVWQRQGLMAEACSAITDFWFETLDRRVLRTLKAAANIRSRRISERDGMRLVGTTEHDYVAGRLPTEVWEITREEWRRRPRQAWGDRAVADQAVGDQAVESGRL